MGRQHRITTLASAGALFLTTACTVTDPGVSPPSAPPGGLAVTADPSRRPVTGGDLGPDVGPAAAQPAAAPAGGALEGARSELTEDSVYPDQANPELDTLHHSLDLTYLDGTLTGRDAITFRAATDTEKVRLDLRRVLKVTKAELDGKPVQTAPDGDGITVSTGPLSKDSRHVLVLEYTGRPSTIEAPSARGDEVDGLGWMDKDGLVSAMSEPYGALTWYPCNDWTADKAYYDVRITTSESSIGVANGSLTGRSRGGGRTVTTWHLAQPTAPYLTTVAIGDLRWKGVPLEDGRTFNLWHRASVPADTVDGWALISQKSYSWLLRHLGPYPFDEVGAVGVNQDSAMETATLVTMGERAFTAQARSVLLHELAHQWYGDSVTPKDWRGMWLNEGWAMFIQLAYLKDTNGQGHFRAAGEECRRSVAEDGQAGSYDRSRFASTNVYMCGAALLQELMEDLGEDEFWAMARAWEDAHAGGNVSREDFESFLEQRYHRSFTALTRKWLDEVKPLGSGPGE